jgi:MoaA/NifB/PqqE/SkfB family radical SAM enzyme
MTTEELRLPLLWLDTLWVQVTGTVCNIACKHCFISCGPKVTTHELMEVDVVRQALDDAVEQGVRAFWYTGGEPFVHPRILELIDLALQRGPLGILTNGMLIDDALAEALGQRFRDAPYNLEVRVSLDGCTREANDRVRGRGVFEQATAGIARLAAHGVEPVLAVSVLDDGDHAGMTAFADLVRSLGVSKPRIKWIPAFRLGREERRRGGRGYHDWERLTREELDDPEAPHRLQCGTSRMVTSQGVFPCPILINEPEYRLGDRLADGMGAHRVDHKACHTCWAEAFSCAI